MINPIDHLERFEALMLLHGAIDWILYQASSLSYEKQFEPQYELDLFFE